MSNRIKALPALILVLAMVISIVPAFAQGDELITHYTAEHGGAQISTLDPQLAEDSVSIDFLENLFLGLTNNNPLTTEIEPELATDWAFDLDSLTWTFTIRDDVPWVRWDPVSEELTELRKVVAGDFVTGIRRACDPNNTSLYAETAASMITGCADVLAMDTADVTPESFEVVGVAAPDDTTLQITLTGTIGYFFSFTPTWVLRAVPGEIIDEFGGGFESEWTEAGNIVTNGSFVLDEWERGVRRVLLRNPLLPEDLQGPGNVERVVDLVVEDAGTLYALFQDNQLDWAGLPTAEQQNVLADPELAQQVRQVSDLVVYYLAFGHDKPPFDDVHVRRAFSAAFNRELFVQEVISGRGVPMMHWTPPGMFGAVPVNEVGIDGEGIGYDPEFAREQMDAAGYPNCEGFPAVNIVTYASWASWAEYLQAEVENVLGCDPSLFSIETQEFSVLLQTTSPDTPTEERPNMWSLGWGPDYGDANNWVFDAGLACESDNNFMRPCTEVDELITEVDPTRRAELYREIEEMFFGYEGEFPMIPLYMRAPYYQLRPWLDKPVETDGLYGGSHYDWISIDQDMQAEARGE